jgi:hypothetical protein
MNQALAVVLGVVAFMVVGLVLMFAIGVGAIYFDDSNQSEAWPPGVRRPTSCELARDLAARGPVQRQTESVWQRELKQLRSQCEEEIKRGTPPAPTLTLTVR